MKWPEQTIDKNKQVDNEGRRPTDPDYIHTKNTYHLVQRTHIVRETLLVKVYDDDESVNLKELVENNTFVVMNEDKQQVLSHLREFQTEREWLLAQTGLVYVPPKVVTPPETVVGYCIAEDTPFGEPFIAEVTQADSDGHNIEPSNFYPTLEAAQVGLAAAKQAWEAKQQKENE